MRERVLKLMSTALNFKLQAVAPHAGACVETHGLRPYPAVTNQVAPHAGACVETMRSMPSIWPVSVAPHAGACVETMCLPLRWAWGQVAPHAGACVETLLMGVL